MMRVCYTVGVLKGAERILSRESGIAHRRFYSAYSDKEVKA